MRRPSRRINRFQPNRPPKTMQGLAWIYRPVATQLCISYATRPAARVHCTTDGRLITALGHRIAAVVLLPVPPPRARAIHRHRPRVPHLPAHLCVFLRLSTSPSPRQRPRDARALAPLRLFAQVYKPTPLRPSFCSLALFAFWLRSSVVSVLFSLISEYVPSPYSTLEDLVANNLRRTFLRELQDYSSF